MDANTPMVEAWTVRMLLSGAADLIDTYGWARASRDWEFGEPMSVEAALWEAFEAWKDHVDLEIDAEAAIQAFAAYVYATTWTVVDAMRSGECRRCVKCRQHTWGPMAELEVGGTCADGCRLCDEHAGAVGFAEGTSADSPRYSSEDVVDSWERAMTSQRIVVSVLRGAAAAQTWAPRPRA